MRKLLILTTLAAVVTFVGTGCLKDKGYDAQEYGMNIQEKKAVAFPESASSPLVYGINSQTTPLKIDGPAITLEQSGAAASDVHVTLQVNNTLATDAGFTPLPAGSYTINLNQTIKAGTKLTDPISFTLNNSSTLDPTKAYGIGLAITAADGGYIIASNMRHIVLGFNIKNAYDGVYRLYGGFSRSDQPTYTGVSNSPIGYYEDYYLITKGPSSNDANIDLPTGGQGCTQIIYITGSGYTYFTGVPPRINVDPATNKVTVTTGDVITAPAVAFTQDATELANSKYYPAGIPTHPYSNGKKTIVAHFRWSSGGVDRITKDTLVYKGPR